MGIINKIRGKKSLKREEKEAVRENNFKKRESSQKKRISSVSAEKEIKKKKTADVAILLGPHITEKAGQLSENRQYIFRVSKRANKSEIKKAIEMVYNVDVLKVRTVNLPRKPKRLGRTLGYKPGFKKAIVTLKRGQEIELIPR